MSAGERIFGVTAAGETVRAYALEDGAFRAEILDYGATVRSLEVPDRAGRTSDVVLGYDTLAEYERNDGYLGALVGRYGNRIAGGRLTVGGVTRALAKNDGENHLHGGRRGFDKYVFAAERLADNALRFSRVSPDGEENYPGRLEVSVTYTLSGGRFGIRYEAVSDRDTAVNLTNHSYFNLNGGGSALSHRLRLAASRYVPIDAGAIPLGGFAPVAGTPFDFTAEKSVGADIGADDAQIAAGKGYDHHFEFDVPPNGGLRETGSLTGDKSGIRMTLLTDRAGVQFYSGNYLNAEGKRGARYSPRCGLCLETQTAPDSPNRPALGNPFLAAGEIWRAETVYAFAAEEV